MKTNLDKFQLIILGNTGLHTLQIIHLTIKLTLSVMILGIVIDLKLNFKGHITDIIWKGNIL